MSAKVLESTDGALLALAATAPVLLLRAWTPAWILVTWAVARDSRGTCREVHLESMVT